MGVSTSELMNITPKEMSEIMNKPPLEVTKEDKRKIIEYSLYFRAKLERGANPKKLHEQAEQLEVKPIPSRPTFNRRI
jgi:hypothetical protein